ncbi:hypothetical protein ACFOVU_19825 [Nocardiopsis sediminis]|uniref:Secreted protein n=1 Tax=Nocardiopsis sediminis TaxID=1778267 RepID=A0ABV8FQ03_9ACTN
MISGATGGPAVADVPAPPGGRIARSFRRRRILRRLRGPYGTRVRIWLLTALCLASVGALFTVTTVAISQAREGFQVIGHGAGPKVAATADLYFALSDMDAQVANILLMGDEHTLGEGRDASVRRYELRRDEANSALLHAAQLAGGDPAEQRTVREVLNGMGDYEQLVAEARLLNDEAGSGPGQPTAGVVDTYRQATDLMRLELLPKAYNLTLESGATVRTTYEERRSDIRLGPLWVAISGTVAVGSLVALQLFLRARFRRRYNPALAAATVGVLALVGLATGMLQNQAEQLRTAKEDGLDSVIALSSAQAISTGMNADQSRWLLDPERADTYAQSFFEDAQTVLYVEGPGGVVPGDLLAYDSEVGALVADRSGYRGRILGFLGDELDNTRLDGQAEAQGEVLRAYDGFLRADREMRAIAGDGRRRAAVSAHMGGTGSVEDAFDRYEESLINLTSLHRATFDNAVNAGDRGRAGWDVLLPASTLAFAVLILAGVRPRLAEYR